MANESKETIIIELQIKDASGGKSLPKEAEEVKNLATSIIGLQQANKKLREERNKLDTSSAESVKKIQELNDKINKNNLTIKENSSSLEKQRLNVGNYASALDRLIPGLGGAVQGIGGMTKASYAFIATGIGAIIAAVGLALGALVTFLKNSTTGMDFLEDASAAVGAVFNVLVDRVTAFVGGVVKLFSGDITSGLKDISSSFSGIGDEMEREIGLAKELSQAMRDLEDAEIDYSITAAETENKIKRLLLQAKNRTLSEEERISKLNEAIRLEQEMTDSFIKNKEKELKIANDAALQRLSISRNAGESEVALGKRIIAELKKDNAIQIDEERKKINEAIIAREQAEGQSIAMQEKAMNQRDALEQKALERRTKAAEDEEKEANESRERRIEQIELFFEREQQAYIRQLEFIKTFHQDVEVDTKRSLDWVKGIREKQDKDKEKADKKLANDAKTQRQENITGAFAVADASVAAARGAFGDKKEIAIAETIINTISGMVRALADYKFPYGAIVAALVGTMGSLQTQRLAGITFGLGGKVLQYALGGRADKEGTFNGPSHAGGGIDYIRADGKHRINVEGGENFYVLKKSASREINRLSSLNQKHGGVAWEPPGTYPSIKYASGGQVVAQNTPPDTSNIERVVRSVMETMPPIYTTIQDINEGQGRVARIVDGSQLL